jgi:DNA-binding HxlR family transcriptional regulator
MAYNDPKVNSMSHNVCPKFDYATKILGKRWVSLILYELMEGPKRFHELEQTIGVTGKMLSDRLKELEEEQLVLRTVYAETPVRIEYSLTERGTSMRPVMQSIRDWANEWVKK